MNNLISEITSQYKNLKVLVIENDQIYEMILDFFLHKISDNIIHAYNGTEAIKTCFENPDISLILIDINVSGKHGSEIVVQQLRQMKKKCSDHRIGSVKIVLGK